MTFSHPYFTLLKNFVTIFIDIKGDYYIMIITLKEQDITEIIADRYNLIIKNASVRLYALYVALYVNNNSQSVVAEDWDCSVEYIKQLCKKLQTFILKELNKEV